MFSQGFACLYEFLGFFPSWKTIQNWILRIGLFKILKRKEKANDWIFIVDFKVQAGRQKCLIVLGVRMQELIERSKERGSLCVLHEDMHPLGVYAMEKSSGERIAKILEEISEQTGPAYQVIADHGSDVNKGLRIYCESNQECVNTYDIVHKLAVLLGAELKNDGLFDEIITRMNETKQKTKQSSEAPLAPPRIRDKARFMNLDIQIDWLEDIERLLGIEILDENKDQIYEKLGWVLDYKEIIKELKEIIAVIKIARNLIREKGLYRRSCLDFSKEVKRLGDSLSERTLNFARKIFLFLYHEGRQVPLDQIMLGSSEGIESIIGKYKQIEERTTATKSMTANLLAIGAMTGSNTIEMIREALIEVPTKMIDEWKDQWIGESDLSRRQRLLGKCNNVGSKALVNLWVA